MRFEKMFLFFIERNTCAIWFGFAMFFIHSRTAFLFLDLFELTWFQQKRSLTKISISLDKGFFSSIHFFLFRFDEILILANRRFFSYFSSNTNIWVCDFVADLERVQWGQAKRWCRLKRVKTCFALLLPHVSKPSAGSEVLCLILWAIYI